MSVKELTRVGILARVKAGTLTVKSAAVLLHLGYRQAKRVVRREWGACAAGLSDDAGGRRHQSHVGAPRGARNDLGRRAGAAVLDRDPRGPACALHRLEERLRASAERRGAGYRRGPPDAIRADVRGPGH